MPQPRSDLTSCRVERLPSGTCVLDLPRNRSSRFEAFSAVYRAPGLFSTALVMNFQSFADGLNIPRDAGPFAIRFFAFHARADSRRAKPCGRQATTGPSMVLITSQRLGRSRDSRVYRGLSAGPGDFLPFGRRRPVDRMRRNPPAGASTTPGHRLSPQPSPRALPLLTE